MVDDSIGQQESSASDFGSTWEFRRDWFGIGKEKEAGFNFYR